MKTLFLDSCYINSFAGFPDEVDNLIIEDMRVYGVTDIDQFPTKIYRLHLRQDEAANIRTDADVNLFTWIVRNVRVQRWIS